MLKSPCSADPPSPPGWTAAELARLETYLASPPPFNPNDSRDADRILAPDVIPFVPLTGEEARRARRQRFEALVKENLRRLTISQLRCILRAIEDPRLSRGDLLILKRIIERTGNKTGMAFPGRDWMAANVTYYDSRRAPLRYSPKVIGNKLSRLGQLGYLEHDKRGVDGKGRPVSHYVTRVPDADYLCEQITEWCRKFNSDVTAHVVTPEFEANDADVTAQTMTSDSDVTAVHLPDGSDVTVDPLNSPRESRKHASYLEESYLEEREVGADAPHAPSQDERVEKGSTTQRARSAASSSPPTPPVDGSSQPLDRSAARKARAGAAASAEADHAIELYNEAARRHGWVVCQARPTARLVRLQKRLAEVGGLAGWQQALSAIPFNDWMMGRVAPRDGRKPFKLDLEYLLQTDGKSGDVLAKLLDSAATVPASNGHGSDWSPAAMKPASWRAVLAGMTGDWPQDLGPPPGSEGCLVPPEIIRDLGLTELYTTEGSRR
jgi:hypothetical protein